MRVLCASTLIGEFLVVGLAGLAATRLTELSPGAVWGVSGAVMALCLLLAGMLGRPGAVALGWVLQAGLVLSGVVVPVMFFLGAVFALLWWASVHYGRKVDEAKARHAAGSRG